MTARRWIAFGLIAIPAVMTALLSNRYILSSGLIIAALAGAPGFFQLRMRRDRQVLLLVGIILFFALKWRFQPLREISGSTTMPLFSLSPLMEYSIAHAMAQGLLTFLTALLFLRREKGLPLYVSLLSANAMVLAGNIPILAAAARGKAGGIEGLLAPFAGKPTFLALSLALAGLTALYFMTFRSSYPNGPVRRPHLVRFATLLLLAGTLVFGGVSSRLIYVYRNDIDVFLGRMAYRMNQGGSVGFSRTARLGSVAAMQAEGGTAIALRIFSDSPPGYMRGMAFDTFLGDQWDIQGQGTQTATAIPPASAPELQPGERALQLREAPSEPKDWRLLAVSPTGRTERAAFAPLGALYIYARSGSVSVDSEGAPVSSTMESDASYRVAVPEHPEFAGINEARRQQLTVLPENIDPRVRELAKSIVDGCPTTQDKIDAVVRFFTSNFDYQFGIEIPEGEDPITWFLLNRPPAHCEYFASGAAILLRLAGIPTRYVTGYMVGAKNTYGKYWIARDKDAHAWVEAYDPERGWVTVEATPAGGRPSPGAGWFRQVWDYLKYRLQALREAIAQGDIVGVIAAAGVLARDLLLTLLKSLWTWLLLVVLAGFYALRYRRRRTPRTGPVTPPQIVECQTMLARMDGHVAKQGHTRAPSETLNHFAGRLEQANLPRPAKWYHAYVAIRYQPDIPQEALTRLGEELESAARNE